MQIIHGHLPSLKLTYPLKMVVSNKNLLFQGSIFRGYVSFREGMLEHVLALLLSLKVQSPKEFQHTIPMMIASMIICYKLQHQSME